MDSGLRGDRYGSLVPALAVLAWALPQAAAAAEDPPVPVFQWGSAGTAAGEFDNPWQLEVDADGNVYVADNRNARIQKFTAGGVYVTEFGSFGSGPYEPIFAVALDGDGQILAGAHNLGTVQTYTTDGVFLFEWPVPASHIPTGLAVGIDGSVFVGSEISSRIFRFSSAGSLMTQWSTGSFVPEGMAVDQAGDLFVAVGTGVQKYSPDGLFIAQYGQSGSGNGQFVAALDVALDSGGNMIVPDYIQDRVQKLRYDGLYLSQWPLTTPLGAAVEPSGTILVSHRHEIVRYDYIVPVESASWGSVKALFR